MFSCSRNCGLFSTVAVHPPLIFAAGHLSHFKTTLPGEQESQTSVGGWRARILASLLQVWLAARCPVVEKGKQWILPRTFRTTLLGCDLQNRKIVTSCCWKPLSLRQSVTAAMGNEHSRKSTVPTCDRLQAGVNTLRKGSGSGRKQEAVRAPQDLGPAGWGDSRLPEGGISNVPAEMSVSLEELEATAQEVLGRLRSHQPFQSSWDTAAFVVFLTFIGTVLFLLLLVLAHCCCGCCCGSPGPQRRSAGKERHKGVDNLALEP
nr:small integral membrane protein 22 isoform X2 [Microcebus murinus]